MAIKTVLISPSFTKSAVDLINTHLNADKKLYMTTQVEDWQPSQKAEALIVRSKDTVTQKFINQFPNLKIIATATSGFDHIDRPLTQSSSVKFCHSPNANVTSASETTLWHILNILKKGSLLNSKQWKWRSEEMLSEELCSKQVSLIGLGRIGKSVAKKLSAFDCKVSAYDPYIEQSDFDAIGVRSLSFEEALSSADILSLHCPLTHKTSKMINASSLKLMKKSAFLVNCARGPLVDETALVSALESNRLSGACLDVFESEPLEPASRLRKVANLSLSPHIGGYTIEAQNKSALEAAQQVKNWFEQDQPVLNVLPPAYKWAKDLEN